VVASDEVEPLAMAMATHIAAKSPIAVQTIKEAVLTLYDLPTQEAFAREAKLGQRAFTSDRAKETLAGFVRRGFLRRSRSGPVS